MKAIWTIILFFGLGIQAQASISVSPASVNFFSVEVGSFGQMKSVNIRNTSEEDINVSVSNSCFGDYNVVGFCSYIPRFGSCNIRIEFRPRRVGYQTCSISVRQTSGGVGSAHISVSGRGVDRR